MKHIFLHSSTVAFDFRRTQSQSWRGSPVSQRAQDNVASSVPSLTRNRVKQRKRWFFVVPRNIFGYYYIVLTELIVFSKLMECFL